MSTKKKIIDYSRYPIAPILIVDDENHSLNSFNLTLRSGGYNHIVGIDNPQDTFSFISENEIEILLLDILMPAISGIDILAKVTSEHPDIPVIMITGVDDVNVAVDCMQNGAFDYILKPVKKDRLIPSVRRAVEVRQLRREKNKLVQVFFSEKLESPECFSHIITNCRKMRTLFHYCEAIAPSLQPILITGETGVGKELMAESIHKSSGRIGEFVAVNVAGLDDNVVSDTLFGHVKGAYTGADKARPGLIERASGGTLFLDEIGDLKETSQIKLLRLLDKKEYFPLGSDIAKPAQTRFVFATNKDLREQVRTGQFREDLFYRLQTHTVHLPPLREREEDIPLLFSHFLEAACKEFEKPKPSPTDDLLESLSRYNFPGNVREFKAMVYDAISQTDSPVISTNSFKTLTGHHQIKAVNSTVYETTNSDTWIRQLEPLPSLKQVAQTIILEAMRRTNNNQRAAALLLGISPQALNQRIKKYSREE